MFRMFIGNTNIVQVQETFRSDSPVASSVDDWATSPELHCSIGLYTSIHDLSI